MKIAIWLAILSFPASVLAGEEIDVIRAGREDIGAFDAMLERSQRGAARKGRENFGAAVSAEAKKARDLREGHARGEFGARVSSQKSQGKKGSASSGAGSSSSARGTVPRGQGRGNSNGNSGNGNGNSHGNSGNH